MKTILDILTKAGGWHPGLYLKIENSPYMELVIEAVDESGPCGLPAISVAHYAEQNGDAMRDPEMCFELGFAGGAHLNPYYWRNDYVGIEQWSRFIQDSNYCFHTQLHAQHTSFCEDMGQEPAAAGFRGSLHGQVHRWLVRSPWSGCPMCAAPQPSRPTARKEHTTPCRP